MKALALTLLVSATACIAHIQNVVAPQPTTVGTLTCAQIVTDCDRQCGDPFCVSNCTGQGTAEAQPQHAALVDCAQRNACTDEACIRASCNAEATTCEGPAPAPPEQPEQPEQP